MRIELTTDKMYPIRFNDSFGEGAYLHRDYIFNDDDWKEFLAELEKARQEAQKNVRR